jgi:hypothetical protein
MRQYGCQQSAWRLWSPLVSEDETMKLFKEAARLDAAGDEAAADRIEAMEAAEQMAEEAELDAEIARLEAEEEAEFQANQAYLQSEIDQPAADIKVEDAKRDARWAADELKAGAKAAAEARKAKEPTVGKIMKLRKVPTYSRIRVVEWGSIEEVEDEVSFAVDDVVTLWTKCREPDNTFAAVEVRGVLGNTPELQWLPEDARVEIVDMPRFADQPAELARDLKPMKAPQGSNRAYASPEGFHALVWDCDPVFSPVQGWSDPETSVEVLLCALNVAPDDGILRPQLLAALRARYARVKKDKDTYPPKLYPWRDTLDPSSALLKYLRG